MSQAAAVAIAPGRVEIVAGSRVYQSQHEAHVINDSGADIVYDVDITLSDSQGKSCSGSFHGQVAPGNGPQQTIAGPFNLGLDANSYNSGDQVSFICETRVSGGLAAFAQGPGAVTVP